GAWGSSVDHVLSSPATVTDNAWHHVALTKDGTNLILYLDGSSVASTPMTEATYYQGGGIAIGRDGDSSGSYFPGNIDEVAVYDHALSASQVAAHWAVGAGAATWSAPSVPYQNGELNLALYGGR